MSEESLLCVVKTLSHHSPFDCRFADTEGCSCLPVTGTALNKANKLPSLARTKFNRHGRLCDVYSGCDCCTETVKCHDSCTTGGLMFTSCCLLYVPIDFLQQQVLVW